MIEPVKSDCIVVVFDETMIPDQIDHLRLTEIKSILQNYQRHMIQEIINVLIVRISVSLKENIQDSLIEQLSLLSVKIHLFFLLKQFFLGK